MCLYTLQSSGGDESDDADEKTCKVTEKISERWQR